MNWLRPILNQAHELKRIERAAVRLNTEQLGRLARYAEDLANEGRVCLGGINVVTCEAMPRDVVVMVNPDTGERVVQRVTIEEDDGDVG